jgi:glycerophosphoryl diester phosphodiesterase
MAPHPYLALPGPWLVAHRGGGGLAPENTLAAFDLAVQLGADALEIDVRRTRDGEVVIFHDEETSRLTGRPGTIEARTLDEVGALDAGACFTSDGGATFPFRGAGLAVPTLAQALAQVLTSAGAEPRACVGSFHDLQAERLGTLLPGCARYLPERAATCHVLAAKAGASGDGCPGGYQLASLPHRVGDLTVVDRAVVDYFHARGLPVHVWTVDDPAEQRALLELGVDGIVTDRPDLLRQVLGR